MSDLREKVYALLEKMPAGKVTTYGRLAARAGAPGAARRVGTVLKEYPGWDGGNCYRVVRADGKVGGYRGEKKYETDKVRKLEQLGCKIKNKRIINLGEKMW